MHTMRQSLLGGATAAALVLAGINAGGNLGADIHHSGTVAAAREAAMVLLKAAGVNPSRKKAPR